MRTRVVSVADRVQQRFDSDGIKPYLEAFRLDCDLRNLSPKTISVYFERSVVLGNRVNLFPVEKEIEEQETEDKEIEDIFE